MVRDEAEEGKRERGGRLARIGTWTDGVSLSLCECAHAKSILQQPTFLPSFLQTDGRTQTPLAAPPRNALRPSPFILHFKPLRMQQEKDRERERGSVIPTESSSFYTAPSSSLARSSCASSFVGVSLLRNIYFPARTQPDTSGGGGGGGGPTVSSSAMNKCCIRTGKSRRKREREREEGNHAALLMSLAKREIGRRLPPCRCRLPHTKDRNGGGMAALARSSGVESLLFRDGHISPPVVPIPTHEKRDDPQTNYRRLPTSPTARSLPRSQNVASLSILLLLALLLPLLPSLPRCFVFIMAHVADSVPREQCCTHSL